MPASTSSSDAHLRGGSAGIALARLLWLSDSALPIGAFTSSGGWEVAVRDGLIASPADVEEWLEGSIDDLLVPLELPLLARAHRARGPRAAAEASKLLDRRVAVPGWSAASRASGARLLELAGERPREWHRAVAVGWVGARHRVPLPWALAAHAHATLWSQAQAGVRLGVVSGDVAAQGIAALAPRIAAAIESSADGRIHPSLAARWEIAGMRHPLLSPRLFAA